MPQYAIIQSHESDVCPMTNKAVREFALKSFQGLEALGKKLGVKVLLEIHLDPDHKAFMLFEAASAEAVRDYVMYGGYAHFTNMEFHLVTPVAELIKHVDEMPTIY